MACRRRSTDHTGRIPSMRHSGPLPVAVPETARAWLDERRELLARRLTVVGGRAARGNLEEVRIAGSKLTITPPKANTPEAARSSPASLRLLPLVRITDLLAEVDHWTGLSARFTHLRTGLPADDTRVVLTAVLGGRHQPRPDPHGRGLQYRHLFPSRLDGRIAFERGELSPGSRHCGQCPAEPTFGRLLRRRRGLDRMACCS